MRKSKIPSTWGQVLACAPTNASPSYDLSHFSIMGTAVGAHGVPADSDRATFEKVTIE